MQGYDVYIGLILSKQEVRS